MELKLIEINEFKKDIYKHYKKMFPRAERKSYKNLKRGYNNKITNFYKIIEKNELVGFIITQNANGDSRYILLDFLAILPIYQCKGFGKQAVKELNKIISEKYLGLFAEVEKAGLGKSEKENEIRERRIEFYEKLGFFNSGIDINLSNVVFSVYVLTSSKKDDDILNNLLIIYNYIWGEKRKHKNFEILTNI